MARKTFARLMTLRLKQKRGRRWWQYWSLQNYEEEEAESVEEEEDAKEEWFLTVQQTRNDKPLISFYGILLSFVVWNLCWYYYITVSTKGCAGFSFIRFNFSKTNPFHTEFSLLRLFEWPVEQHVYWMYF